MLQVLWEIELGVRIESREAHGLGKIPKIDEPRHFTAYFHALKWSATTAADGRLFQAPFRADIQLLNDQLTPLSGRRSSSPGEPSTPTTGGLGKNRPRKPWNPTRTSSTWTSSRTCDSRLGRAPVRDG